MKYRNRILAFIVLIGSAIGIYFVIQFYAIFFKSNTQFSNAATYVFIDMDDTIDSLTVQLTPLLKSVKSFHRVAEKKGYDRNIKTGKFSIAKGSSNNTIINNLRSKRLLVNVVFNNQERLENLAGRVAKQIEPDSLVLMEVMRDSIFLKENGFNRDTAIAMYLPNSYQFYWHVTPIGFRNKMLKAYHHFWNKKRLELAKEINLTPLEIITLASIVQKETTKAEESSRVAGVYVNRLRKRMLLQADPTVIFSLKKATNNFDTIIRRVLYKDLKIASPFNTYQNRGLPPGPIFMPDLATIDAVLNYEKHNYIYFVANPKQPGYHLFARTVREHNRNKRVYTNWLNKKKLYR